MDIKELLERLFNLTYRSGTFDGLSVISTGNKQMIEDTIKGWAMHQDVNSILVQKEKDTAMLHSKIGELEAKVFAYEAFISNSNFKPFVTNGSHHEPTL